MLWVLNELSYVIYEGSVWYINVILKLFNIIMMVIIICFYLILDVTFFVIFLLIVGFYNVFVFFIKY